MEAHLGTDDRLGLVHPSIDVHTIGISSIEQLLSECGIAVLKADASIDDSIGRATEPDCARAIRDWIKGNHITAIRFSYQLDPDDGLRMFSRFMETLDIVSAWVSEGGCVNSIFFSGQPRTCDLVEEKFPQVSAIFRGDETPAEVLDMFGISRTILPERSAKSIAYDESLLDFGRDLVAKGDYKDIEPLDRRDYYHFGEKGDSIAARVAHGTSHHFPPLMRTNVGPYLPHGKEAVALFLDWTRKLAKAGLLDVLSIGTSRLSRSDFWRNRGGRDDSGGLPIATPDEFAEVWRAARPMLVRSSAATKDVSLMAHMLEENIDIAWHDLSLWWSCKLDGRGPNTVMQNLGEHTATLQYIAKTGKPFEPDVPQYFACRGADDLTYVLSGFIAAKAAKAAKSAGVQKLILQVTLNAPKYTWGINDLAKARALLHLVKELEDSDFKVYLQPRAGLDCFSRDTDRAKAQLAAVTALMDDIEPHDATSPQIIHVVSYSEGYALADPDIVNESIRITRHALKTYRAMRESGDVEDMASNPQVLARTSSLLRDARLAVAGIESAISAPYTAEGLYEIMASGFFAVPFLSECRDEFPEAVHWKTACINGVIEVVDENGRAIAAKNRLAVAVDTARSRAAMSP
jgi:hypothetical protein